MPNYERGAPPTRANLGLKCLWWGGQACMFLGEKVQGRTGCSGAVDMACLCLRDQVPADFLTDWERQQVGDPTLGRRPPEIIDGEGGSQEG